MAPVIQPPDTVWTDVSPAIAGARDFQVEGQGERYTLALADVPISFELDRPRWERGELFGYLTVKTALVGARTYLGILQAGTFNSSSTVARTARAKQLADLAHAPQIDWHRLLEEFCIRVNDAERSGGEAIDLSTVQARGPDDSLSVHGLRILEKHPIILFGDGGTGKSLIALAVAGELTRRGLTVLFCDWELDEADHAERYASICGPERLALLYLRCSRPMSTEADRILRVVRNANVDYLICDSAGYASDGRPEDAEVALRYFQCLRRIGIGSLTVAHTNKSDDSDKKPFGSSFWHNSARATWNVKSSEDARGQDGLTVGLFNRKSNLTSILPSVGLRIGFNGVSETTLTQVTLADVDDLSAELPMYQRIREAVKNQPQTLASLADELGAKADTIARAAKRKPKLFTSVAGSDGIHRIALLEHRT